jgi:hypothetical protein
MNSNFPRRFTAAACKIATVLSNQEICLTYVIPKVARSTANFFIEKRPLVARGSGAPTLIMSRLSFGSAGKIDLKYYQDAEPKRHCPELWVRVQLLS